MTRCTAAVVERQPTQMEEVTYDDPPKGCAYKSKLNDFIENKQFEKALSRISMNRVVKIRGERIQISQAHKIPREVECKVEPYFRLPLHSALYHNAPFDLIKALVEAYPASLKVESVCDGNWLPLHMACAPRSTESLEQLNIDEDRENIILYLMEHYAHAVNRNEPERKASVMHLICEHRPPKNLLMKIIKVRPDLVRAEDNQGNIPLHVAYDYHAGKSVIKSLLHQYPEGAIYKRKYDGFRPLHCAAFNNCSSRSLPYLIRGEYAEQVENVNSAGETPLHIVFDAERYLEKWEKGTGNATKEGCLSVTEFTKTLLLLYAKYVYSKFGQSQGVQKIIHLIKRKIDNEGNSIIDLMSTCYRKHLIPRELRNYLSDIAKEKVHVAVPDEEQQTDKRGIAEDQESKKRFKSEPQETAESITIETSTTEPSTTEQAEATAGQAELTTEQAESTKQPHKTKENTHIEADDSFDADTDDADDEQLV